ncbi:LacI family DNA-binding transcriptional regulator [Heyndrickxia acidicola]|uniref:LacI family DNA-binding transcriptional regulator n=1 Tax=Heyndrickxia acidicola TaxID=209389 RepID=A0ABU6MAX2_9BACI|nr:LacI family DNA-binding transcriptional regulator [Heyndrickxia acidicola]MED1201821.1 LacI family DNA-binding transcriptional regulator [Heyndrickxia acidicola]
MATIKDIAKRAGVSVTTVSRALNGYSDVNEQTRKKIMAVAKELNYSPNTLARGLVMNKSNTLGLLVSGMSKESVKDNFTYLVLAGINQYAGETDYDIVLFSTNSTKQREKTYSQLCRERRVDGAIIQGIRTDDPYLHEVIESDIPCVLIDISVESDTVGYVTTDNIMGAKKAVQHLVELGHRDIAMINGHDFAFVSQKRLEGYKLGLKIAGIPFRSDWVVKGFFEEAEAEKAAWNLLENHPEITAIFCASDLMAFGAMSAAKKRGLRVPEDLSIVGYDDILLASYSNPPLTTIAQDVSRLGYHASKLLVEMLEGRAESHNVILDTALVNRSSTAKRRPLK